jgi:hypothetical protein
MAKSFGRELAEVLATMPKVEAIRLLNDTLCRQPKKGN